jgi:hypothetical protein
LSGCQDVHANVALFPDAQHLPAKGLPTALGGPGWGPCDLLTYFESRELGGSQGQWRNLVVLSLAEENLSLTASHL